MKKLSFRAKITLHFTLVVTLITVMTVGVTMIIGNAVLQKGIRDGLVTMVAANVDEVEYFAGMTEVERDNDADIYIEYGSGYLEIDDDFLDSVNGICTSLCAPDGSLLYGENPIAAQLTGSLEHDRQLLVERCGGEVYYVYDRRIEQKELEGLYLRGIVSDRHGVTQVESTLRLSLTLAPLFLLMTALGGYVLSGRFLRPVKRIRDAAEKIRKGNDLGRRIALKGSNDELHMLADTFDSMFDRLERSFEDERQVTSDASHELRTPVSDILSQCEYTLERDREPGEYREALELVERQATRMSSLIGELLDFTRMEQKAVSTPTAPVELSALTCDICADMALAGERGITLESDIEPGVTVAGYRDMLARLLVNLISNAYRYGVDGGRIIVALREENGVVSLSVADDGIGIPADEQQKIWNRFYQGDRSRGSGGTGLGLAIVSEIARIHGGEMSLESAPGKGSRFVFTVAGRKEK